MDRSKLLDILDELSDLEDSLLGYLVDAKEYDQDEYPEFDASSAVKAIRRIQLRLVDAPEREQANQD